MGPRKPAASDPVPAIPRRDLSYVSVQWSCPTNVDDRVRQADFPRPWRVTTVGVLAHEEETHIVIARDYQAGGVYLNVLAIPRKSVIAMQYLLTPADAISGHGSANPALNEEESL